MAIVLAIPLMDMGKWYVAGQAFLGLLIIYFKGGGHEAYSKYQACCDSNRFF